MRGQETSLVQEAFLCYIADGHRLCVVKCSGARQTTTPKSPQKRSPPCRSIDLLAAEGIKRPARFSPLPRLLGDRIVALATGLGVDLVILNFFEEGGARAKAKLASNILKHNPRMAVLVARPTT